MHIWARAGNSRSTTQNHQVGQHGGTEKKVKGQVYMQEKKENKGEESVIQQRSNSTQDGLSNMFMMTVLAVSS